MTAMAGGGNPNDYDISFPHDGPRLYANCKKCGVYLGEANAHCKSHACDACGVCMPNTSKKK